MIIFPSHKHLSKPTFNLDQKNPKNFFSLRFWCKITSFSSSLYSNSSKNISTISLASFFNVLNRITSTSGLNFLSDSLRYIGYASTYSLTRIFSIFACSSTTRATADGSWSFGCPGGLASIRCACARCNGGNRGAKTRLLCGRSLLRACLLFMTPGPQK